MLVETGSSMTTEAQIIYVPLEDEGVAVLRPVRAVRLPDGSFRIEQDEPDETERWRFVRGDVVRCEARKSADGIRWIAVERTG